LSFTWIFDLDNTLHNADPFIFKEMNRQMTAYVAAHVGISLDEADALRLDYWRRYGATLNGLMRHHKHIDPEHFLRHTHDFPQLEKRLTPMRGLKQVLRSLPGKKILFTNAPLAYAVTVLRGLRIAHHFDGVIAIQQSNYRPKPLLDGYHYACRRYRLNPRRCIMVEDMRGNLLPAKRLGMRTVWLRRGLKSGPFVDAGITRLMDLRRVHERWLHQPIVSGQRGKNCRRLA